MSPKRKEGQAMMGAPIGRTTMTQELPPPDDVVPAPPLPAMPPHPAWPPPPPPPPVDRGFSLRRRGATLAVLTGLVAGSAVGGFLISRAATSAPGSALTSSTGSTTSPSPSPGAGPHGRGGLPPMFRVDGMSLLQDAASAIGISESTLQADLAKGQSIAQVATANGKTAQDVITALVSDATTAINNAVSSGKLTSSQASTIESHLTQMITDFVNRTPPPPGSGPGPMGSGQEAALKAAATAIGITPAELRSDIAGGQSIAQVASAHSVATSTVESAVDTALDSAISSLQQAGKLTSAQASQLTSEVPQRVSEWVSETFPGWPFGPFGPSFMRGGPGPGGPGPFGPQGPTSSPTVSPSAG
jgi:hypothetical protein